jgi:hypothetical protein
MIRYIILIVVSGIVGAVIAKNKGRDPFLWFFLCALVPLLVIAIALLPPKPARGINKKCPYCSEIIKADAKICKYCGMGL